MMRRSTIWALALLTALGAARASGEEPRHRLDLSLRLTNSYANMRGFVPSDEPALQPGLDYRLNLGEWGTLHLGWWGNLTVDGPAQTERDYVVDWTVPLLYHSEGRTLTGTVCWSKFMIPDALFEEWMLGLKWSDRNWSAGVNFMRDYEDGQGNFAEGVATRRWQVHGQAVDTSLAALYNHHYAVDSTGVSGFRASVSTPITLTDRVTVTPDVRHFYATHGDFESNWTFGCSISTTLR